MRCARLPLSALAAATLVAGLTPISSPPTASAAGSGDADGTAAVPPTAATSVAAGPDAVRPVTPTVRTVRVRPVQTAAGLTARAPSLAARTSPEPVNGVAVAGVTWSGRAPQGLTLTVRTRTAGNWSGWTELEYDREHGPSAGSAEASQARPGTDPIVLGRVDDVQLAVTSDSGSLPRDMELDLVDPGTTVGTPTAGTGTSDAPTLRTDTRAAQSLVSTASTTASTATPMPPIFTRADWGADERLKDCCVEYGEVHAAFVHHTVNANDYTRAETPAVIRGIYAYHTQGRGWRDIGYNFLIDRFGRIWEGRAGGMSLPVIGAHTLGYNEYAFAASAIGNFETVRPRAAMLDAYGRLFAWKLSLHGVSPTSRQLVGGTTFNAVNGHRDAAQTACPGRHLYAQIPTIISKAASYQRGFGGRDLQHSFMQDERPDALVLDSTGKLWTARGTGAPGFDRRVRAAAGFGDDDQVTAVGDVTGDGALDVMARAASDVTSVYPGRGDGTFAAAVRSTSRWANTDLMAGPGDLDGDGEPDLLARVTSTRSVMFYPGRGEGRFGRAEVAMRWLGGATQLAAGGDFDRDGNRDVLVRDGRGRLVLHPGDGSGTFGAAVVLVRDWSGQDFTTGAAELNGDAWPDVVARDKATGSVQTFLNLSGRKLSPAVGAWAPRVTALALSGDVTGDRKADLLAVTPGGDLVTFPGRRQNWLAPVRARKLSWPGMDLPMVVGDWNRDGNVDAMARNRRTGAMWLYPGNGRGGFGAPLGGWGKWKDRTMITPVGDFDGDGWPDLLARAANGSIRWYPGRGDAGFRKSRVARASGFSSGSTVVAVGRWDGDGAPDVIVRDSAGAVRLYPGNGPGGLEDPLHLGAGLDRYNRLVGIGDLTGDGRPDLLARQPNGHVWLLPGVAPTAKRKGGALAPRQFVAGGWSGFLFA